ncbi:MAG: DUF3050 domain-containing protein, partial [Bacteroidota bacterium]
MAIDIQTIEKELRPYKDVLANHPLYQQIQSIESIKIFMEYHVFAVWDFMSLLKSLQQTITCVQVPWVPVSNPTLARFINEIVWGEESDLDHLGQAKSHYDMYLESMHEVGAQTTSINDFLTLLRSG